MFKALDLAKYIITKCSEDGKPISNLQLQKILFYIQKEYLVQTGMPAFLDRIEAWQYGPVVPVVYSRFCGYGARPIQTKFFDISINDTTIIDKVLIEKRSMDPWKLVAETHRENGAWAKVFNAGLGSGSEITPDMIKAYG